MFLCYGNTDVIHKVTPIYQHDEELCLVSEMEIPIENGDFVLVREDTNEMFHYSGFDYRQLYTDNVFGKEVYILRVSMKEFGELDPYEIELGELTSFEEAETCYIRRLVEQHLFDIRVKWEENLQKLHAEDYKVIKCYEAQTIGEEAPYDMKELHERRNTYRANIETASKELEDYYAANKECFGDDEFVRPAY